MSTIHNWITPQPSGITQHTPLKCKSQIVVGCMTEVTLIKPGQRDRAPAQTWVHASLYFTQTKERTATFNSAPMLKRF